MDLVREAKISGRKAKTTGFSENSNWGNFGDMKKKGNLFKSQEELGSTVRISS